MLPATGEGIKI